MKLKEAGQDYLEAIHILSLKLDYVRAIDICSYFGYARPTVSIFLKQLKENNYIEIDNKNHISLTPEGKQIALETYERHLFLTEFFKSIGVSESVAASDACKVEHYVSPETFEALKKHFSK